jgi:hypothetical protein
MLPDLSTPEARLVEELRSYCQIYSDARSDAVVIIGHALVAGHVEIAGEMAGLVRSWDRALARLVELPVSSRESARRLVVPGDLVVHFGHA